MGRRTLIVGDGAIELAFRSVSGDLHVLSEARPAAVSGPPPTDDDRIPPSPASAAEDRDAVADDDRLAILRAVERGELTVAAAMAELAALDDLPNLRSVDRPDPVERSATDG